jgi:oligopeptide/dipeptide ABC transporter ATP-binding protein
MLVRDDPPSPLDPPPGCRFHTRCPIAEAICRVETPQLEAIDGAHRVACHVALREARQAGMH